MEKERRVREEREFLCVFVCLFMYSCVSVSKSERYLHPSHTADLQRRSSPRNDRSDAFPPECWPAAITLGISINGVSVSVHLCMCTFTSVTVAKRD